MSINVKIKRFDQTLPLPAYQTKGAACLDLYCRKTIKIPSGKIGYLPLNVALEIPKNCFVLLAARGSTHKHGILPVHGIGIGDWDYRGDNDEYFLPAYNFTPSPVTIEKGIRIAQLLIMKYEKIVLKEVKRLNHINRGAFGSTGKK